MMDNPFKWDCENLLGYEPPIAIFMKDMAEKVEDDCIKVIQEYGFNVDKDELMKALNYDRDQYEKGYREGHTHGMLQAERLYARPIGEWIELKTNPPEFLNHKFYICSQCNREIDVMTPDESLDDYPYCHCGAKMEGEK